MNEPSHRDITHRALGGEVKTGVGLTGQQLTSFTEEWLTYPVGP